MVDTLFTAADLAEMRAFSDANLPHSCVVRQGTRAAVGGGKFTTTWSGSALATHACRFAPNLTNEQLVAGAAREVKNIRVVFSHTVSIPDDAEPNTYRLEITHDRPGVPSPFTVYKTGTPVRSYEMQSTVFCSTEPRG